MEHVREHGNLDSFAGNQNEKLALMLTASRQGLVQWDRAGERYGLTSLGRERLGMRRALQESGGPMNLPPAAPAPAGRFLALGSGTILAGIAGVAIGAAAVALLPGSSKLPPRDRAAVAAASKPSDVGNAPRRDEASAARNPGIPCLAEKCLETGGSAERPAQHAANPEEARNAPPPAPAKPEPSEAQAQQQAGVHPGQAGAVEGALLAQQLAPAAAEPAPQPRAAPPNGHGRTGLRRRSTRSSPAMPSPRASRRRARPALPARPARPTSRAATATPRPSRGKAGARANVNPRRAVASTSRRKPASPSRAPSSAAIRSRTTARPPSRRDATAASRPGAGAAMRRTGRATRIASPKTSATARARPGSACSIGCSAENLIFES
jgi:hypothetical protein